MEVSALPLCKNDNGEVELCVLRRVDVYTTGARRPLACVRQQCVHERHLAAGAACGHAITAMNGSAKRLMKH